MRVLMFMLVTCGVLAHTGPQAAAQPAATPAPVTPIVELDQLTALGKSVAAIRYESDNVYLYGQRRESLQKTAHSLVGGQLEFIAKVMRVTETEVIVEVKPAGKTRIVLRHQALPEFGNLRTVGYRSTKSADRFQIFSAPVGVRIGSEIKLDTAKKLRRRDTLVMRGTIDSMPIWIDSVFAPDAVALISNWRVTDVNPQTTY